MNRSTLVLAVLAVTVAPVFSQVFITDTNLVGGSEDIYTYGHTVPDALYISGSTIEGYSNTNVVDGEVTNNVEIIGNGALRAGAAATVNVTNSTISGGAGGALDVAAASGFTLNANGAGIAVVGRSAEWNFVNSTITGGAGGTINADSSRDGSSANGGDAVVITTVQGPIGTSDVTADADTVITGGAGGTFNTGSGFIARADGGDALVFRRRSGSVNGGTYVGGSGGTLTGSAASSATGGTALSIESGSEVTVEDGIFRAGAAGTINGSAGSDGYAIIVDGRPSNPNILDDPPSALTLNDGQVEGDIYIYRGSVNLVGGSLDGDLLIAGGTNTLSLQDSFMNDPRLVQEGGDTTIDAWSDDHLSDVLIQDGTITFDGGHVFNLDSIFVLESETSAANFNDGLTVMDGGTLTVGSGAVDASSVTIATGATVDLGSGTVGGSSILVETGSTIDTTYSGGGSNDLGQIQAANDLTVQSKVAWTINAGNSAIEDGDTFVLATGSTITSGLVGADVTLTGTGFTAGWLAGIKVSNLNGQLIATYGLADFAEALGVKDDYSTEYGKAINAVSELLVPGTPEYDYIAGLADNPTDAGIILDKALVQPNEVTTVLMGQQALLTDQIKIRTRSKMHFDEMGYPSASAPSGAAGWAPMRRFSDYMESTYGYDQVEGFVQDVVPDANMGEPMLPEDWHAWGRGYGSKTTQDDKGLSSGYEATVAGALVGVDRSVHNTLIGLGAGYGHTSLKGNSGKDAKVNSGQVLGYVSTHGDNAFLDLSASYAFNAVETTATTLDGTADFDAQTLGLYAGAGYAIPVMDSVLLTPEASILNTLYSRGSYSESVTALPENLNHDSYDEWSHLSQLGATLSMIRKIDLNEWQMGLLPEVRAHWLHEFNPNVDPEKVSLSTGGWGMIPIAREEDLYKVGAGIRVSQWADFTTELGLDFDGIYGSDGYDSFLVSGHFIHRF